MAQLDKGAQNNDTYITLDTYSSAKGDPGGFGFGGTGSFGGGYGIGGNGPHPDREPHRQAHYRTEARPGVELDDQSAVIRPDVSDEEHRDYPRWLDGFPHSFQGWGPSAPDYDHEVDHDAQAEAIGGEGPSPENSRMQFAADPFATSLVWNPPR